MKLLSIDYIPGAEIEALGMVKGTVVSVLTMLLYKRVARPLFGIHK